MSSSSPAVPPYSLRPTSTPAQFHGPVFSQNSGRLSGTDSSGRIYQPLAATLEDLHDDLIADILAFDRDAFFSFQGVSRSLQQKVFAVLATKKSEINSNFRDRSHALCMSLTVHPSNMPLMQFHKTLQSIISFYGKRWGVEMCPRFPSSLELSDFIGALQQAEDEHLLMIWPTLLKVTESTRTEDSESDFTKTQGSPEAIRVWMRNNVDRCQNLTLSELPLSEDALEAFVQVAAYNELIGQISDNDEEEINGPPSTDSMPDTQPTCLIWEDFLGPLNRSLKDQITYLCLNDSLNPNISEEIQQLMVEVMYHFQAFLPENTIPTTIPIDLGDDRPFTVELCITRNAIEMHPNGPGFVISKRNTDVSLRVLLKRDEEPDGVLRSYPEGEALLEFPDPQVNPPVFIDGESRFSNGRDAFADALERKLVLNFGESLNEGPQIIAAALEHWNRMGNFLPMPAHASFLVSLSEDIHGNIQAVFRISNDPRTPENTVAPGATSISLFVSRSDVYG